MCVCTMKTNNPPSKNKCSKTPMDQPADQLTSDQSTFISGLLWKRRKNDNFYILQITAKKYWHKKFLIRRFQPVSHLNSSDFSRYAKQIFNQLVFCAKPRP